MGFRTPGVFSKAFIGPFPASSAGVAVFTTPPMSPPADNQFVYIAWTVVLTMGTGATGISFFLYRGPSIAAGTLLTAAGGWQQAIVAGQIGTGSGVFVDAPGIVAGLQYTIALTQNGATAASIFQDGAMLAFCL